MTTGKKLVIGGVVIAGLTAYMAYRGASASWQYYLTADECLAKSASLAGRRLRVSGRVAAGTLAVDDARIRASFALEGDGASLNVVCSGPLPDNLTEGMAVLVEGRLDDAGLLHGEKVLTRCAGKYQSRPPASVAQSTAAVGPRFTQPRAAVPLTQPRAAVPLTQPRAAVPRLETASQREGSP